MATEHIVHTIPPTFDERSRVLVLGSIPSPKSRETQFNYGHPQNRFWRVMAKLAGEPVPATTERRRDFCLRHHIALWDVIAECDIDGASDASIANARPNDLSLIAEAAPIEAVYCTGSKAFELYVKLGCQQMCGLSAVKLPSTSPANAACSFEQLCEAYAPIFEHTREFEPPTLDVADVVALEQRIASDGTSLYELMDRAGTALAARALAIVARLEAGSYSRDRAGNLTGASLAPSPAVGILCGSGNNGGDGWVAARILADAGVQVSIITNRMPAELRAQPARDAAELSLSALESKGATVLAAGEPFPEGVLDETTCAPIVLVDPDEETCRTVLERSWVVIDAILGTGFDGGLVKEPYSSWIRCANDAASPVKLACDVASGVSAQRGCVEDGEQVCFEADETLTMICRKPGLVAKPCGEARVAPLAYIEPYF